MTAPTTDHRPPTLTVEEGLELGRALVRDLSEHIGTEDPDALNKIFREWVAALDVPGFPLVCVAALHSVFTECLTVVAADTTVPAGSITYADPPEEEK